jgi:hypothetical protein
LANTQEIALLEADIGGTIPGQGNINGLEQSDRGQIQYQLKILGQAPDEPDWDDPDVAGPVLALLADGVHSYRLHVPVLRVSKLVSRSYPIKASLENVGRLITTETMQTSEGVPDALLFNLPESRTIIKANTLSMAYAWYKNYPNVQQVAGARWSVTQTWEFGLYSTFIYGYPI